MRRLPRRSAEELRYMRNAGRVVAEMHEAIRALARPGITTLQLDRAAAAMCCPLTMRRRTSSATTVTRR